MGVVVGCFGVDVVCFGVGNEVSADVGCFSDDVGVTLVLIWKFLVLVIGDGFSVVISAKIDVVAGIAGCNKSSNRVEVIIFSVYMQGVNEYKKNNEDDEEEEYDYHILYDEEGFEFFNEVEDKWIDNLQWDTFFGKIWMMF